VKYKDAGVDIDAGDRVAKAAVRRMRRTQDARVIPNPGGFAGLFALDYPQRLFSRNYKHPVLVACTDGVGTKLKIAQMAARHDTVGIDLVAMSVNDLIVCGAEPLFFLDYMAWATLDPDVADEIFKGIAEGCSQAECSLLGGETAEMPGFYKPGEYDLAGFAVGVVERKHMLKASRVAAGDVLIGLAASGLHSNGYSLVRKVLLEHKRWKLDRVVPEFGCTLAEELLRPTRIYVRALRGLLAKYRSRCPIRAVAHITGGGLTENLPRILPRGRGARLRRGAWPVPPIFEVVRSAGKIDRAEMFRTFNMGIGMVLAVSPASADVTIERLHKAGWTAYRIGEVRSGPRRVTFR
jgi:phosphoribosylformylglycinamidine cyclo-ligase